MDGVRQIGWQKGSPHAAVEEDEVRVLPARQHVLITTALIIMCWNVVGQ